jgi:tRNA(fMet)-specific endonuclease VapC
MSYLLDTCVLSDLVAHAPHPGLLEWIDGVDEAKLYLSVITIGEIQKGIKKIEASKRKQALSEWLADDLLVRFGGRILSIDTEAIFAWGTLVADLEQGGRPMPAMDSLIAATALQNGLTLVTRNEADFSGSGVPVLNPWTDQ